MDGLREFVKQLREQETPDLLVAVTHTGITIARQLARDIPELDVVLSGHTHERTEEPILEGHVIVVEPGSMGSFLGRLDLTLKPQGGVAEHRYRMIPIDAKRYSEHPEVKLQVEKALSPFRERMNQAVGTTQTPILRYDVLETNADDFITDAIREVAGTDIGLSNGFRFGLPVAVGTLRNSDLWNLLPDGRAYQGRLDYRCRTAQVFGTRARTRLLEESDDSFRRLGSPSLGSDYAYVVNAEPGKRLLSVQVNGFDIEDDGRYTVASCEREGEPLDIVCRIKGTHDVRVLPGKLHETIRKYLSAHPTISPRREGRAYATDLAPMVFSQDAVVTEGSRGSYLPTIVPVKRKPS